MTSLALAGRYFHYFPLNYLILLTSRCNRGESYGYEVFKFDRFTLLCEESGIAPIKYISPKLIVQRIPPSHIHLLGSVVLLHMGEDKLFLCNTRALAVIISVLLGLDNPFKICMTERVLKRIPDYA